ncbi:MAG: ribonuclease III [Candidatus Aminicenantes bacterium]|nr:ribonuclease III [Candidatus Aminicenantes bacterium]
MKPGLSQIEKRAGYVFRSERLLREALTHSSYAYENTGSSAGNNEVLEFLGDSVIGLVTAECLRLTFPEHGEGDLSKLKSLLTSTASLASFAEKIKLDKTLLLGRGEEKNGGRRKKTILAGAFEALAGAVHLDGGFESARAFLLPFFEPFLKKFRAGRGQVDNYKSALQERLQRSGRSAPAYRTVSSSGPQHRRVFVVEVYCGDKRLARARSGSIKDAEQKAAQKALKDALGRKMRPLPGEMFWVKND